MLLLLLFSSSCLEWLAEPWWWVVISVDNQSATNCIIVCNEIEKHKKLVKAKSYNDEVASAYRYSDKENLSDNFKNVKIYTEDERLILELSGSELDKEIDYKEKDKSDDIYLLTITDEMIEEALAVETTDTAETTEETVDTVETTD